MDSENLPLAAVQVFFTPSERIGQPRHGKRKRGHTYCELRGGVYAECEKALRKHGMCVCNRNMHMLINPKLVTMADDVVVLSSYDRPVFTWTLPRDVACVLRLVRAFV